MIPISWNEMICTETYVREERKIAKVLSPESSFACSSQSDLESPKKMN